MNNYICVRHEKLKNANAVKNRYMHNHDKDYRINHLNVNEELTQYNKIGYSRDYVRGNTLKQEFERMAQCYQDIHNKKLRKDAIQCIETVYTISPDVISNDDVVAFARACMDTHRQYFPGCPAVCDIHIDETTIHAHMLTVPYNKDGQAFNKVVMNIGAMRSIQDDFAENCRKYNIMVERGISKKKNETTENHEDETIKKRHMSSYQFFNSEQGKIWLQNRLEQEKNKKVAEMLQSDEIQQQIFDEVERRKQEEIEHIFNDYTDTEYHGIIGEGTLDDILR